MAASKLGVRHHGQITWFPDSTAEDRYERYDLWSDGWVFHHVESHKATGRKIYVYEFPLTIEMRGATGENRTLDNLFTREVLCQLSYGGMAGQEGLEPSTPGFGDQCSTS
jgi:hypothetical protein